MFNRAPQSSIPRHFVGASQWIMLICFVFCKITEERQWADDIRLKISKCRPSHGVIVLALSLAHFPFSTSVSYLHSDLLCWTDWVDHAICCVQTVVSSASIRTSQRTRSELSLLCRKLLGSQFTREHGYRYKDQWDKCTRIFMCLLFLSDFYKIIIMIIIFINCSWVVTRWQWLFYMYTKYEIGYW